MYHLSEFTLTPNLISVGPLQIVLVCFAFEGSFGCEALLPDGLVVKSYTDEYY